MRPMPPTRMAKQATISPLRETRRRIGPTRWRGGSNGWEVETQVEGEIGGTEQDCCVGDAVMGDVPAQVSE